VNSETLYEPIGDVIREDVERELAVKLSDLDRLGIADAKAAVEDEVRNLQERFAEVKRDWSRRIEDAARRVCAMGAELRSREQIRAVPCYERWRAGQIEVVRRDMDPRDPSSVVERRSGTAGEAQRALPAAAEPQVEVEPAPPTVDRKRKAKRA
jgi:hypothetical protein